MIFEKEKKKMEQQDKRIFIENVKRIKSKPNPLITPYPGQLCALILPDCKDALKSVAGNTKWYKR